MPILEIPNNASNGKRPFCKQHSRNKCRHLECKPHTFAELRTEEELYVFVHKFAKLQNRLFSKCLFNQINVKIRRGWIWL